MPKQFVEMPTAATTVTRKMKMKTHSFTIIASGLDPNASNFEDRFFEAGCDDATITFQKGAIILEFDREGKNLSQALHTAMCDVKKAGACVQHVEPDHLVNLSDIAVRAGVTRAAASLYASGKRGSDFPAPVARVTTDSALWDWAEVAHWLFQHRRVTLEVVMRARLIRNANLAVARRGKLGPEMLAKHNYGNVVVLRNLTEAFSGPCPDNVA